jgi:hypothetical protein
MRKRTIGLLATAMLALPALPGAPTARAATSSAITITGSTGVPNRVGDNETSAAHDGSTSTGTFTTPSYTTASPAYLEFSFDSTKVNRIRLYKNGEYGPHDLTIQYTTGTGALDARSWTTVSGLANGFEAAELLDATAVNSNGTVTGDVHDSPAGDGWASLTFDTVTATGVRIAFTTLAANNHYRVFEFQAYYDRVLTTVALGSGQDSTTSTSPVTFDVTFESSVTGFDADDVDLDGSATTGTVVVTDADDSDDATYTVDVAVTTDGDIQLSIPAAAAQDAYGTDNAASNSASVDVDSADPVLGAVTTTLKGAKVTARFSATDASSVTFECAIDNTASYAACTSPYVASVAAGTHTVFVRATDAAGNDTEGDAEFTVKSKRIK